MMDGRRVELSLMLLSSAAEQSVESPSDANVISRRKRKQTWDEAAAAATSAATMTSHQMPTTTMASVDLQHHDPLPLDWEQCLDLQSGRMYYMNRKTLKKTWSKPKEQKLDLELNICSPASPDHHHHHQHNNNPITNPNINSSSPAAEDQPKRSLSSSNPNSATTSNMVTAVCINCHLLVMICRSSPSCPNCKHVNSLLLPAPAVLSLPAVIEPPRTLSLLH